MNKFSYHTPLFLKQIVALLNNRQITKVIDATFGEGGHGLSLAKLGITVLGIEVDEEMFKLAKKKIEEAKVDNIKIVRGNYRDLAKLVRQKHFGLAGAVIMDLGLSMYQLENSRRGFSYRRQGNLDLRLSRGQKTTAAMILKQTPDAQLIDLFTKHIESPFSGLLVQEILSVRKRRSLQMVSDLQKVIALLKLNKYQTQDLLRQTLQGLRIIVNDEFGAITQGIKGAVSVLAPGGLLIVMTYHSLEDRLVKRLAIQNAKYLQPVNKVIQNRDYQFAKSGKLRVYAKKRN